MANDLVAPTDLTDYPGAPFTDTIVDSAVTDLRGRLGWHVAPVKSETITFDHEGGRTLILPSRKVVTVDEIRDVSGDTPVVLTEWRLSPNGYVTAPYWPCGTAVIEVDLTHGYAETPEDVAAAVAGLSTQLKVDPTLRSVQIDDFQQMMRGDVASFGAVSSVVTNYGLPRDF